MSGNRPVLALALIVAASASAVAQEPRPDSVLLPVAGQQPMPPAQIPLADPSAPPQLLLPAPPTPPPPPAPAIPLVPRQVPWTPTTDPLLERQPTVDPHATDHFWVRAGLLLGWSERAAPPETWRVPATGATVNFPPSRRTSPFGAGMELETGLWLTPDQKWGVDGGFIFLDTWQRWRDTNVVSSAVAGYRAGVADTEARFRSADVNLRHRVYSDNGLSFDALAGYRYAELRDTSWVDSVIPTAGGGVIFFEDRGRAITTFNGGQIGLAMGYRSGRWSLDAVGKVALGAAHVRATFTGDSANAILAGAPGTIPSLDQTRFAVLPSVAVSLGYDIRARSRISVGYTFQYLNVATRATDILRTVGDPLGSPLTDKSGYWMQGLTLGWEWRY